MINWKEMRELHVIRRLEGILAKWFHVESFFTKALTRANRRMKKNLNT